MKKTLLFLVGNCLVFISQAQYEKNGFFIQAQYGILAHLVKTGENNYTQNSSSKLTNKPEQVASSPTSVSYIEEFCQRPENKKPRTSTLQSQVAIGYVNKTNSSMPLRIRRPISLEDQAALHGLVNTAKKHPSQFMGLKDCGTPDLGRTPKDCPVDTPSPIDGCETPDLGQTPTDCKTPDLGTTPEKSSSELDLLARRFSNDSYSLSYDEHPTPPLEDENYDRFSSRSNSSDSQRSISSGDFFLGSVSSDSPKKSKRQRSSLKGHLTPDLGDASPRK